MKHTHITSEHRLLSLNLKEVWQYRELIGLFTKRGLMLRYAQTVLGPLWIFINPLLTSLFYVLLFGQIAKLSTDGVPQLLFYMTGNALWTFFSKRVSENADTFTGHANLFGKVYFPRLVIPASDLMIGLLKLCIQLVLVFAIYVFYFIKGAVRPCWLMLPAVPLAIGQLGLLGLGIGIIISSCTTRYRDLSVLLEFGLQLWMYGSPIVYPISSVSGPLKTALFLNPVTAPVELIRSALFGTGGVPVWNIAYSVLFTVSVLLGGIVVFNKVERTFVDTV